MGLILDTCILIESERRGEGLEDILRRVRAVHGDVDVALAAVTGVELTHGIYRAVNETVRAKRRLFVEGVFQDLLVHPLTLEIAQLAGRIEGEQAAAGNTLAFQDLLIGNGVASRLHCNNQQRPALPCYPRPECGHALSGD